MSQIKCPKCGEVFTIDESSYNEILNQIKKEEIEAEVLEKLAHLKVQNEQDIIIERNKIEASFTTQLSKKNQELQKIYYWHLSLSVLVWDV